MNTLKQRLAAESHLRQAASDFLDACTGLRAAATQFFASTPNQFALEYVLDEVRSHIDAIESVESRMHESRAVLHALLNSSTSRVPINKLPPETLGRIFSIVAASSPCTPLKGQRDALLDAHLVCVRWHQIASTTPSLLSHIDLHFGFDSTNLLDRAVRRLDLCRGTPIHVHLSGCPPKDRPDAASKLVSILEPHAAQLSSLRVRAISAGLLQNLFALYLNQGTPGYLKVLVVSNIRIFDSGNIVSWPTSSLKGLVELELRSIHKDICPHLAELAAILSHSPRLHTLRLAGLELPTGPFQHYSAISLPCLRMLEISYVHGEGLPQLLSMISPGVLELDLRLEATVTINRPPPLIRSLLARSNIVALTMNDIEHEEPFTFASYLSLLPRLRALHINISTSTTARVLGGLATSTPNGYVSPLTNLQSLCLSNGLISNVIMGRIKHLTSILCLQNIVFLSCTFRPSFGLELSGDGDDGSAVLGGNCREMPESTKRWLSERVKSVFVWETAPLAFASGGPIH